MSKSIAEEFLKESNEKSSDLNQREVIAQHIEQYNLAFEKGKERFHNLSNAQKKANLVKWRVMENLDRYLIEFESNFKQRGGHVIWANTMAEAQQEIWNIVEQKGAKSLVKSKSSVAQEIELNSFLRNKGIQVTETNFGDYCADLIGEKPFHMNKSIMQLRKEDVVKLFHEKFDMPEGSTTAELQHKTREMLRDKFIRADIGLTGANFLIADTGSVAVTENEGNARLATTFPKTHIVLAGIEKIIPNLTDLNLFWPLLSSHGTGQNQAVYNSILNGPKQRHETDGPEDMYVILLDNGRTNLLAQKEQRQGLYCIRCGACLHACPVYQNIGGHVYNTTYQGPIGALITPHMRGMKDYKHLSFASPLSGKTTEVCPVNIDIDKMLLLNRRDSVQQNLSSSSEKRNWKWFSRLITKRKWLDFFGGKFKNYLFQKFFKKSWGENRELPKMADKSFSQQWKEKNH